MCFVAASPIDVHAKCSGQVTRRLNQHWECCHLESDASVQTRLRNLHWSAQTKCSSSNGRSIAIVHRRSRVLRFQVELVGVWHGARHQQGIDTTATASATLRFSFQHHHQNSQSSLIAHFYVSSARSILLNAHNCCFQIRIIKPNERLLPAQRRNGMVWSVVILFHNRRWLSAESFPLILYFCALPLMT